MKKAHLTLAPVDLEYLEGLLAASGELTTKVFKRATALLELNSGKTFAEVSATVGTSKQTVSSWRDSYNADGLSLLKDKPRPGRPVRIDTEQRAKIIALASSEAPAGHLRWSLRLLAEKAVELGYCEHLSHDYAGDILKKVNAKLSGD